MNQHDEAHRANNQADMGPRERLRAELLVSGLYDYVPLVQIASTIAREDMAETLPAQQELALQTIRSLVEDGLVLIGDLPFPGETFAGWDLSIDAAMDRVYDLFVGHYEERQLWDLTIWLALTPAGERLARELRNQRR
ncbi:hypothetical protein [Mycobacterium riyadhense]|uniref:Uncharacterized protein n=1 Tax=Mycobacterium riyadhense TaxID=486698 RepID=A0A1X2CZI7_9MYCO|nr:hypothetical protein [Mycobacterium riyadhense]MCV7147824.1 hypothetical protein [Mycobacterium riyadhense]ORW81281.1 hypothetical protein AWC22_17370 [Mycobacterium riyadhense]VTP03033.1 hypothetical protein BIN_B_04837 [Mycobacterium riyadhense]